MNEIERLHRELQRVMLDHVDTCPRPSNGPVSNQAAMRWPKPERDVRKQIRDGVDD